MEDLLPLICIYFAPALVALCNGRASWEDRGYILFLNAVAGWTVIGYFIVMMIAVLDFKQIAKNNREKARIELARNNFYLREDAKHH